MAMLITGCCLRARENSFGLPHRKSFIHSAAHRQQTFRHPIPSAIAPMIISPRIRRISAGLAVFSLMAGISSCRKKGAGDEEAVARTVVIDTKLRYNRVADQPSALYQSQVGSPIHWQPWTQDTLEMARKSHRLLFVVIALPQLPTFLPVLEHLSANPAVVASLNHEYVPVLVDADAVREIGLLAPMLCAEINQPLQLPIFLWMTYEGNPVGWIPVHSHGRREAIDLFDHSHGMISRMWREDSDYVLRNSALDNENRRVRMDERRRSMAYSNEPEVDVIRALRKMTSLYDPYTRSFDEAGGLFPFGALELLSVAARQPGIPPELREKCGGILEELLQDLLPSAMFDPLEGGVFSSRRGPSWALPSFYRDCMGQARAVSSLVQAWHASGDEFALERARSVLRFAEDRYKTGDGLYVIGMEMPGPAESWMWTQEEVGELLPAGQAEWWIRESGIKGLGNLPSESDPRREFFRANSISLGKSPATYAAAAGAGAESFLTDFNSSRKTLLDRRHARQPRSFVDRAPHAGATFRMVSAYAAMFTVAGDEEYRKKAVELLHAARVAFSDGRFIRSMKGETDDAVSLGRAFHYALALQAALDVAAITGDAAWTAWAEDLATLSAEQFTGDGILKECPDAARILDLPISDTTMLFDDSTTGLFSISTERMAAWRRPMVESFRELVTPLPSYVTERPILHTDLLLATLLRHYPVKVTHGGNLPESMAEAVRSLALRGVLRGEQVAGEGEEGVVKVVWPGGQERVVRTAEELRAVMAEIRR
jgi:uncharacterized protein YyaL (SSP411 family)